MSRSTADGEAALAWIEPAAMTAATLLATKALEALGTNVGENAWAGLGRLATLVRRKTAGHREAADALEAVQRHPDDPVRIRALAKLLASFEDQDTLFRRELDTLIADARRDPVVGPLARQVFQQAEVGQVLNVGQMRDLHLHTSFAATASLPSTTTGSEVRWPAHGRSVSNLPPRNFLFTGRRGLLVRLHQELTAARVAALVQARALHGLGGVGKTHLALEYAHRYAGDYELCWWVRADQPATIPGQLVALARRLGMSEAADQAATVGALFDELRHRSRWLLVFDNVERPHDLHPYWPSGGDGHLLITSRYHAWTSIAASIMVEVLPRPDAIAFLRHRIRLDERGADSLAHALGDLPLGLEQAAAYLEETGTRPDEYLHLLHDRTPEMFALGRSATSEQTIATTWAVALDRVRGEAPVAQDLLSLIAFLGSDDLPRHLITTQPDALPERLASAVRDRLELQKGLGALQRMSLVTLSDDSISVHRLVQAVVRHSLGPEQRRLWAGTAIRLIRGVFPDQPDEVESWPLCARLLPHALVAVGHAQALDVDPVTASALLNEVGNYLWGRAAHLRARAVLEQALAIEESRSPPSPNRIADRLNNLGNVLENMGDLTGARDAHERALAIRELEDGGDDFRVAQSLNNLGNALRKLGDVVSARARIERALAILEGELGPDSRFVGIGLFNLALVMRDDGDSERARELLERAIGIQESQLGPDHPRTAATLHQLALVLYGQGEEEEALELLERAVQIYDARLGPDHPAARSGHEDHARVLDARR